MSRPVPAPRTHAGKQVAKFTLEKVSVVPEGTSTSSPKSISSGNSSSSTVRNDNNQPTGHSQNHLGLIRPIRTDLNLTALISEVERDIWLLEQLENNSSTKRALQNPLELPFPVTEEILKLPGYKPGRNRENAKGSLFSLTSIECIGYIHRDWLALMRITHINIVSFQGTLKTGILLIAMIRLTQPTRKTFRMEA